MSVLPTAATSLEPKIVNLKRIHYPLNFAIRPTERWLDGVKIYEQVLGCTNVCHHASGSTPATVCLKLNTPGSEDSTIIKTYFNENAQFGKEAESLGRMDHPSIVKQYDAFQLVKRSEEDFCRLESHNYKLNTLETCIMAGTMQQSLAASLRTFLHQPAIGYKHLLNENLLKRIFMQIGSALAYMHRNHFLIHNDLTDLNICVRQLEDTINTEFFLVDFGSAEIPKVKGITVGNEQFAQAEMHSRTYANVAPSLETDSELESMNDNMFLVESYRFAIMLLRYSIELQTSVSGPALITALNNKLALLKEKENQDLAVLKLIHRMARKPFYKVISISHIWDAKGFQ